MSAVPQLQCKKGKLVFSKGACVRASLSLCACVCMCVCVCLHWSVGVWAELHGEVRCYLLAIRNLPSLVHVHVRGGG